MFVLHEQYIVYRIVVDSPTAIIIRLKTRVILYGHRAELLRMRRLPINDTPRSQSDATRCKTCGNDSLSGLAIVSSNELVLQVFHGH